jgi:hypothetical protein
MYAVGGRFRGGFHPDRTPVGVCGRCSCWRETPPVGYNAERAGLPEPLACQRRSAGSCLAGRNLSSEPRLPRLYGIPDSDMVVSGSHDREVDCNKE